MFLAYLLFDFSQSTENMFEPNLKEISKIFKLEKIFSNFPNIFSKLEKNFQLSQKTLTYQVSSYKTL